MDWHKHYQGRVVRSCGSAFLDYASIFFGTFWENEHFFSFFLGKELLAFSVILHDCIQISALRRVFSIMKASFNEQQDCALVDYIQASVMAQYNKQ